MAMEMRGLVEVGERSGGDGGDGWEGDMVCGGCWFHDWQIDGCDRWSLKPDMAYPAGFLGRKATVVENGFIVVERAGVDGVTCGRRDGE